MEYGVVTRAKPGQSVSGDTYLFQENHDATLVALIDGLGSGQAAHTAAMLAKKQIAEHTMASLPELLRLCDHALRGTRGAVMMLMRIEHSKKQVSFAGIGNIGVKVFSDSPIKPISRNGIVGYRMPSVREFIYSYSEQDVFILHSDGISTRFIVDEDWVRDPSADLQDIAQEIADEFGKEDDVTIIVTRQKANSGRDDGFL